VLVAEDAKFFDHQGFDTEQIEFAIVANHQAGKKARGASTITQQVAKNLYLSKDKEMTRKLREAAITLLLEHYLGKDRILEIYLNIAQFGPGLFGVGSASRHHYKKELAELSQDEIINLLSLLPSPVKWSFRRPNNASTGNNWQSQAYSDLAEQLSEERWKVLRTRPNIEWGADSSGQGGGPRNEDGTAEGTAADPAQAPRPGLGNKLRTF
jgi:membrane peptidoglycan carboxypeptidase